MDQTFELAHRWRLTSTMPEPCNRFEDDNMPLTSTAEDDNAIRRMGKAGFSRGWVMRLIQN